MTLRKPVAERFWPKVAKGDRCWEWTGSLSQGYGSLSGGSKYAVPLKAHRVSWELHFGPIPDGLFVCHHCDNRRCVRPDHLFLGTNADNIADASGKGRLAAAQRRIGKLTPAAVGAIRADHARGVSQRSLADRYGVHPSTVSLIVHRKLWVAPC